jgi:hypothetical protein
VESAREKHKKYNLYIYILRFSLSLGLAFFLSRRRSGEFIKSMVFGALDGIITTFAVVASVAGPHIVLPLFFFFFFLYSFPRRPLALFCP